jgi:transposase
MPISKRSDPKLKALKEHGVLNPNPQTVKDPSFQENVFFDARDLVQVKYEMLRRANIDGWSINAATQAFGLSRPTYYQANKAFKKRGFSGLLPKKRGPKRAHKLTEEVVTFIKDLQRETPTLKAPALAKVLTKEFNLVVHPRSIERALTRKKKRS